MRRVLHRAQHHLTDPGDAVRQAGGDSLRATAAGLPLRFVRPTRAPGLLRKPATDGEHVPFNAPRSHGLLEGLGNHIAHEVVSEREHKPGDLRDVIAAAQAEVDRDIKANFEANTAKRIQLMLMASQYLARVNQSIDRAMAEAGEPLTPEQVLPLAVILMETYGSPNNPHTRPTLENIDPATSLTVADGLVFQRASRLLAPHQLIFKGFSDSTEFRPQITKPGTYRITYLAISRNLGEAQKVIEINATGILASISMKAL